MLIFSICVSFALEWVSCKEHIVGSCFIFFIPVYHCLVAIHSHLFCWAVMGLGCCTQAFSSCGVWATHCSGFSCCRAPALGTWVSVAAAHGLSSCGSWAQLLCGMCDPPRPGIKPMSLALKGGFPPTGPPEKPSLVF